MRDPDEGVSPEGTIVTGARRDRVPAVFERVLAVAADELSSLPEVSLYVYGSVATGQARVGRSDVDLMSIGLPVEDARAGQITEPAVHRVVPSRRHRTD